MGPRQYEYKHQRVVAVQWPGGEHDVPHGWTLSPVPQDFGCGRSCYNPDIKCRLKNHPWGIAWGMSLWRGDWCVWVPGTDLAERWSNTEFQEQFCLVPGQDSDCPVMDKTGQFLLG